MADLSQARTALIAEARDAAEEERTHASHQRTRDGVGYNVLGRIHLDHAERYDCLAAALAGAAPVGRTEWGVRFEKPNDITMAGVPTVTMPLGGEAIARQAVSVGSPMSGTGHRLVKRTVTDWEEAE